MKKTQEIEIIKEALSPIAEKALHLNIDSDTSLKEAVSLLSQLNQFNDNITAEKEKVTKPANEILKAERARWKPIELVYQDAIDSIRSKMTVYQTLLVQTRKAEEEAIARRIGAGKGKISLSTAVNRIDNLATVEKEHATEEGLVQFREKKQLRIVHILQIPLRFMIPNEPLILETLKNGMDVPGCELETIQIPINYR